ESIISRDPDSREVIVPYAIAKDLTSRPDLSASRYIVCFRDWGEDQARQYDGAWKIIEERVRPERAGLKSAKGVADWQFLAWRHELHRAIEGNTRVLVGPNVAKWWFVVWLPAGWCTTSSSTSSPSRTTATPPSSPPPSTTPGRGSTRAR